MHVLNDVTLDLDYCALPKNVNVMFYYCLVGGVVQLKRSFIHAAIAKA